MSVRRQARSPRVTIQVERRADRRARQRQLRGGIEIITVETGAGLVTTRRGDGDGWTVRGMRDTDDAR